MMPDRTTRITLRASSKGDARGAFTLLEMVAVLTLLGILALAAAGVFRPQTVGDMDGHVTAERIAWNLRAARRRAIATGDNHVLVFQTSAGVVTGYTLNRRNADTSLTAIDAAITLPTYVTVTASSTLPEFTFEGDTLAGYTFTVTAPHKAWTITVAQATGSVRVQ
jgi:prepilin-type N-terminal cleavage/methylation domain-containing protein